MCQILNMKLLLTILCLISYQVVFGQSKKFVDLIQNEIFELNGGLRSQFGGKSRTVVPVNNLPANTIGLVYTVQAYKTGENVEKTASLALALSAMMTGNVALAKCLQQVNIPSSTQTVDLYLLPSLRDAQLFLSKNTNGFNQYFDYSKLGCTECRVTTEWPLNDCSHPYIAIRNPSAMDAIRIVVNVAAVISE